MPEAGLTPAPIVYINVAVGVGSCLVSCLGPVIFGVPVQSCL